MLIKQGITGQTCTSVNVPYLERVQRKTEINWNIGKLLEMGPNNYFAWRSETTSTPSVLKYPCGTIYIFFKANDGIHYIPAAPGPSRETAQQISKEHVFAGTAICPIDLSLRC